jgi:hypothetical protein
MTINIRQENQLVTLPLWVEFDQTKEVILTYIFEQYITDDAQDVVLTFISKNKRWVTFSADFNGMDTQDGQAHYTIFQDGIEKVDGRLNFKIN